MLPTFMPTILRLFANRTTRVLGAMLAVFSAVPAYAQGPNITYTLKTDLKNGLHFANSVAADSAGNIFVTDISAGYLYKETPNPDGSYTPSTISTGASQPYAVAIDAAGNLYVADNAHTVYKETLSGGTYTESIVASTFTNADGLAVDATGNVYVLDAGTGAVYLEKLSGTTYTQSVVTAGFDFSAGGGIAVDTAGNVYVAETAKSRALKETPSNGAYTQSIVIDSSTFNDNGVTIPPDGIAVDSTGAVIITNQSYGTFKAAPSGTTYTTTQVYVGSATSLVAGIGASIDSHGNLYIADMGSVFVATTNELAESSGAKNFGSVNNGTTAPAQSATFTFDVGGTLASTPYAVSTQGDLTLDFQAAPTQAANVCVAGKTYNPGDTCTVAATFSPTRPGVRYGAIVLFAPSGSPIATSYLQGIGVAPQVSFSPGQTTLTLGGTFTGYVSTDSSYNAIINAPSALIAEKYNVSPFTGETLTTSFTTGYTGSNGYSGSNQGGTFGDGLVIDGAGNLIFSDGYTALAGNPPYQKASPGATSFSAWDLNPTLPLQTSGTQTIANRYGKAFLASIPIVNPITPPYNNRAAVDGAGNLYFSDDDQNRIVEEQYIHGAYNNLIVVATGFNNPGDVVVDAAGAVYVLDIGNNRLVKEAPKGDGTYTQSIVDSGFASTLGGLAIDRIGNLYLSLDNGTKNMPVIKETLTNGTYTRGTLTIPVNSGLDVDPAGNVFAVQTSGSINSIDELDVATPPSLTFATTAVGSTSSDSPQTVTVVNNGNAPLTFSGALAITAGYTVAPSSTCLQFNASTPVVPGSSCTLNINFIPTQSGNNSGTLTLTDNHLGISGSTQVIKLNGQGTGTATVAATLSPSTYDYGSVNIGSSGSQNFTLTNTGGSSISITSASLSSAAFTVIGTTCATSLAAGGTCTYSVVFKPSAAGPQTATLSVTDAAGTQTASLTGNGVQTAAAQAALTPATYNFGSLTAGTTSAPATFTLTNAGNAALAITSFGINGTNAASFQQGTSTCGSSLAAGASCTVVVTFAPTIAGTFTAMLTVTDAVGMQASTLTGAASSSAMAQAALSPAAANFGSVNSGSTSAAQTFTLSNAGNAALNISSVGIVGTNASSFSIGASTCGSALAAGASCTVAVSFAPTSAGNFTATLSVTDTVGTQTSALTGTSAASTSSDFIISANPAAQASYRGTTVSFSVQLISASASNPFTSAATLSAAGLPVGASVSFSPTSMVPGSAQATTSNMTVIIPAVVARDGERPAPRPTGDIPAGLTIASLGFAWLCNSRTKRHRLLSILFAFVSLAGLSVALTGCGSSTTGFAIPTETSTIIVTATSGSTIHSTTVTLTIK